MKYFSIYFSMAAFAYLFYLIDLHSEGKAEIMSIVLCFIVAISFAIAEHLKTRENMTISSNAMVIATICAIVLNRTFHAVSDEEQTIRAFAIIFLIASLIWIGIEWIVTEKDKQTLRSN